MSVWRGADECGGVPRNPPRIPTEVILAGKRDSGVTGKEDTIITSNPASHPEGFQCPWRGRPTHRPAATQKGPSMKIVVIGSRGRIGSRLVPRLRERGHETVAADLDSGVNTLTGQGLAAAVAGASVVVDVSNSLSSEDAAVMRFFQISTRNLLAAESAADVGHHVAL